MSAAKSRKRRQISREKRLNKQIGRESANFLLNESDKFRVSDPQRSQRLYSDAKKLAQRGRFHLPKQHKILFCKKCNTPFSERTVKVRLNPRKKQIHYQCLVCKSNRRFGYGSHKKGE